MLSSLPARYSNSSGLRTQRKPKWPYRYCAVHARCETALRGRCCPTSPRGRLDWQCSMHPYPTTRGHRSALRQSCHASGPRMIPRHYPTCRRAPRRSRFFNFIGRVAAFLTRPPLCLASLLHRYGALCGRSRADVSPSAPSTLVRICPTTRLCLTAAGLTDAPEYLER